MIEQLKALAAQYIEADENHSICVFDGSDGSVWIERKEEALKVILKIIQDAQP